MLLFLDGDTLAGPDCLARHAAAHSRDRVVARGEMYHLRCTRPLEDPETGRPRPGEEARVARLGPDLPKHLVTRTQVAEDFASIERRAEPGIYPGAGPRMLAELELDAMRNHPGLGVLWMAATGHNLSARRDDFLASGGFDDHMHINEHREWALRMTAVGIPLVLAPGARTYHLTHRTGWRNPLTYPDWERRFYERHPLPAVKLMTVFWASLSDRGEVAEEARIMSLPELDRIARGEGSLNADAVRRLHPKLAALD